MAEEKKTQDAPSIKKQGSNISPTKKSSTVGIILFVVIIASFIVAPIMTFVFSWQASQFKFGSYGSRPVVYAQGSYFAQLVEQERRNFPANLTGSLAFEVTRYFFERAFRQAMMREAWIYESKRAGVNVSISEVARSARAEGITEIDLAKMSVVQRSELFNNGRLAITTERFQQGLYDGIMRPESIMNLFINPVQKERQLHVAYFPLELMDTNFLDTYTHIEPLQKWQLRRYVHLGNLESAQEISQQIADGEMTINQLALLQNESSFALYKDAYAESAGLMPVQFLYQVQQQVDLSINELYQLLSTLLESGRTSDPIRFLNAPAGEEAYVFYQVEERGSTVDMGNATDKNAVITYLSMYESDVIETYFNDRANLINSTQFLQDASNLLATTITTDYFSMVYGLDMRGGYSPYRGLINQFDLALADLGVAVVKELQNSRSFFHQAFTLELDSVSSVILLESGVVVLSPISQRDFQSENMDVDSLYMEQFLRLQAQGATEDAFRASSRYNDSRFERTFLRMASRMNLSPQLSLDELSMMDNA
ncbi:hypothetical protein PVA45_03605 [Entomospira entomophila]|uniref:PpiC domain-containing protein n=1 Tax=Entomospira entomophila TaxID=2719988 RepID=A0A968G9W8_9SPIO|nr:hypothetical protein [Entomospira entomophilus]NIZ40597.1 hypothetical protein [Entomospira entomophilus]WDI34812.1 hypothetical protein PVA45_03605 [Entomospira entomophilus]